MNTGQERSPTISDTRIRALGGQGILNTEDIIDFHHAEQRVALLLCDGEWHTAKEIRLAAGTDGVEASEGLRRFRAVRAKLEPKGYVFERDRPRHGSREFIYRMLPPPAKETLF